MKKLLLVLLLPQIPACEDFWLTPSKCRFETTAILPQQRCSPQTRPSF